MKSSIKRAQSCYSNLLFNKKESSDVDDEFVEGFSESDSVNSVGGEGGVGGEPGERLQQPLPITLILT